MCESAFPLICFCSVVFQLSRQNSLEQRWQDVIGLLNMSVDFVGDGLNQTIPPPDPVQPVVQNVSLADLAFSESLVMPHGKFSLTLMVATIVTFQKAFSLFRLKA